MSAQTVITHVPNQGGPLCAQCAGFGVARAATHIARYLPVSSTEPVAGARETLCAFCASDTWTYCDVQPLASRGVSLVKATNTAPAVPMVLIMDTGSLHGWDTVARVRMGQETAVLCSWCDEVATCTATDHADRTEYACQHHAYRYGRFVEAYAVRPGPGMVGRRGALVLDWGFTESV